MDLNKSLEFFNPGLVKKKVHIIGCGAVGSHVAELLARLGITNIHLWDDDVVMTHNIANQNFTVNDFYTPKVLAVESIIKSINPDANVTVHERKWEPYGMMTGYVFMCVDSVVPRQQLAEFAVFNDITIFDMRMGLTSGQYYVVTKDRLENYKKTLQFTDEEADALTPKTACNFTLSVAYSIWALVAYCVKDAVVFWKGDSSIPMTTIVDMDGGVIRV